MNSPSIVVERIYGLPSGFSQLLSDSLEQNFGALEALFQNFESGKNTFNRRGEALFAAFIGNTVVGIGGLNVDPYANDPKIGRIRHLYVLIDYHKGGVGRALVSAIEQCALEHFDSLQLFTNSPDADAFYRSLGYQLGGEGKSSHFKDIGQTENEVIVK